MFPSFMINYLLYLLFIHGRKLVFSTTQIKDQTPSLAGSLRDMWSLPVTNRNYEKNVSFDSFELFIIVIFYLG